MRLIHVTSPAYNVGGTLFFKLNFMKYTIDKVIAANIEVRTPTSDIFNKVSNLFNISWKNLEYGYIVPSLKLRGEEVGFHFIDFEDIILPVPEKWAINMKSLNEEQRNIVGKWFDDNDQTKITNYSKFGETLHYPLYKSCHSFVGILDSYTEITFEQFEAYILKQTPIMEKKIIGYLSPFDLFNGNIKKGDILVIYSINKTIKNQGLYVKKDFTSNSYNILPKEIVETWEPVYEEKKEIITSFEIGIPASVITIKGTDIFNQGSVFSISDITDIKAMFVKSKINIKSVPVEVQMVQLGCGLATVLLTKGDIETIITKYKEGNA